MPVVGFLPTSHGLQFPNWWPPGTPDLIVHTPIGDVPVGNAAAGLCGGFCFAARDLFEAGRRPPADTTAPPGGSAIVEYLTWRLLASWNIPSGLLTYYSWAKTPDHDSAFGLRRGLARMTIEDQIPQVTLGIDQGKPCPLGLVTVYSADPRELGKCHQVLAYGYDWQGAYFRVQVYDPNKPRDDGVFIGLDTSNPGQSTYLDHNVAIGLPIRGFFLTPYTFNDPTAIAGL